MTHNNYKEDSFPTTKSHSWGETQLAVRSDLRYRPHEKNIMDVLQHESEQASKKSDTPQEASLHQRPTSQATVRIQ